MKIEKIGFGGGCHWCTEAVFLALNGVVKVEQGWIASDQENDSFSEAIIVQFDALAIPLAILIEVHLRTHKSDSNHGWREKYRSAIYYFQEGKKSQVESILEELQDIFQNRIITQILPFKSFRPSRKEIQNYYFNNPEKPFCQNYIEPKLKLIIENYSAYKNSEKLKHLI